MIAFATTANAITILYNFENNGNDTFSELQFDGVTSSGTLMTINSFGEAINQGNRGLGVSGAPVGGRLGLGEALIFSVTGYNIEAVTATFFETGNQDEDLFFGTQAVTVLGGGGGASTQSFS